MQASSRTRFSKRSELDLRRNALSELLTRVQSRGASVLDLTVSNPTQVGLPVPRLPALDREQNARYEPLPFGLLSARRAIAQWMATQSIAIDPERIALTASTSEAYSFLFKLLCDPGDDVLVPRPSYPLLAHLAQFEGIGLREYPIESTGGFHVSRSALHASVGERTRAVIAVHPNNPTGSFLERDELHALAELGVPLISDEVFAPYRLEVARDTPRSALELREGLVMTLHGLSKLGLPQMKLSWICVGGDDAEASQALGRLELIADAYLSVGTPVQLALPEILDAQAPFIEAIRARIRENLSALQSACRESAVSALPVAGGWNAVLRMPATQSDESWALTLLERAHVLVQPGYFYDFEGPPHVVVSLLPQPDIFRAGVKDLLAHVQEQLSR